MYCKKCGNELAENARFCKKCGAPVTAAPQGAAPQPPPPPPPPPPAHPPPPAPARPIPAPRPAPAAKRPIPRPAAKPAAARKADKIDGKLIAAVAIFLVLQLAVVKVVVSRANAVPEAPTVPAAASADQPEGTSSADYFGGPLRVGGKVEFGHYEQDGDTSNGPEPIVWDVVGSLEDGYLLVSRYILDGMPWDDGSGTDSALDLKTEITYEQCSMRRWLRDSFPAEAFSAEELALILPVSVKGDDVLAEKGNRYATDCAFILREDEVKDLWGYAAPDVSNASLACAVTDYAAWSGLELDYTAGRARYAYGDSSCTAPWALRRRYTDASSKAAKIVTVTSAGRFSNAVVSETMGVRPAIYVVY